MAQRDDGEIGPPRTVAVEARADFGGDRVKPVTAGARPPDRRARVASAPTALRNDGVLVIFQSIFVKSRRMSDRANKITMDLYRQ